MNVRKIQVTLEVTFWNIVISMLTVIKRVRSYSYVGSSPIPSIRINNNKKTNWKISSSTNVKLKKISTEIKSDIYVICFWAMIGFVSGFIFGLILSF